MKGLLLKDFYALLKYCKSVICILVAFVAVGFFSNDNGYFFLSYPCIFGSILPVTLMAYDEKEKWNNFVQTLPVSKSQYVSGKYVIGLILTSFFVVLTSVLQMIKMLKNNSFDISYYLNTMVNIIDFCLLIAAFVMPVIFKFGTEKGRIAYLLAIGIFCALFTMASMSDINFSLITLGKIPVIAVSGICVIIYILSWILSIKFYKSREIK